MDIRSSAAIFRVSESSDLWARSHHWHIDTSAGVRNRCCISVPRQEGSRNVGGAARPRRLGGMFPAGADCRKGFHRLLCGRGSVGTVKRHQPNACSEFVSTPVGAARRRDRVGIRPGARMTGFSSNIRTINPRRPQVPHRSPNGHSMNAEEIAYFSHGVCAGKIGAGHRLVANRELVAAGGKSATTGSLEVLFRTEADLAIIPSLNQMNWNTRQANSWQSRHCLSLTCS